MQTKDITGFVLSLIIGFIIGWRIMPHTKIISQTVYKEPSQVVKVELDGGWECEEPKMDTDLLQPSGYWIGSTIGCWKLQTPIDQFRIEECARTKQDYWCNKI